MRTESDLVTTLLLASLTLPSARQLAAVASKRGWPVHALDETPGVHVDGPRAFYGGTDRAAEYALRYQLCLIEPPLDLLSCAPFDLLAREVRYGSLASLAHVRGPVFVKPANPLDKCFDAGVYRELSEVRGRRPLPADTPVLVSQAVEWTSEFRCFVRESRVEAWSPYLSFGRPTWKPSSAGEILPGLTAFCQRLHERMQGALPPAYVVDIGVLEDGRWAIVEFNPAWCSGILGAHVAGALRVIQRAAFSVDSATGDDLRWTRLSGSPESYGRAATRRREAPSAPQLRKGLPRA